MAFLGSNRTLEEQFRGSLWDLVRGYFDEDYQAERKRKLRKKRESRLDVRLLTSAQAKDLGLEPFVEAENAREARRTTAWP